MPWSISKRNGKFCVIKKGETKPVPGGCHPSMAEARRHQQALYANEPTASAVTVPYVTEITTTGSGYRPSLKLAKHLDAIEMASFNGSTTNGDSSGPVWEGILGVEGLATDDGRYLMPGQITERELPLPLMAQFTTEDGHKGAHVAGRIDEIWRVENTEHGPDGVEIWGRGPFDEGEAGQEAARLVENEVLRGVSLDLSITGAALLDPETLEEIDTTEGFDLLSLFGGDYLQGIKGSILGATLCAHPAFAEASVRMVGDREAVVATGFGVRVIRQALTAAAAGKAPLKPPRAWFEMPELDLPTPLTVTEEGQVFGHLALWDQCHSGFGHCERANRSKSGYAYFHTGRLAVNDGSKINVGRITVGEKGAARGGHASSVLGTKGAMEHYDNTACIGAYVRAKDGRLGIWLAGAVRSDCPAERIRDMEANPPSLDLRWENGCRELVAALCVPVGGLAIPRYEALVASSDSGEVVLASLVPGYSEETEMARTRAEMRLEALAHAKDLLTWEGEEFADITAEQRRKYAKSGVSLPDGSFPIPDCSYAEKAIHAQGRAPAAKRPRVVAHIRKRVRSLGCSGSIFDSYK